MDNLNRREKNCESMKVHLPETLKRDLNILAAYASLELSAYVRQILEQHAYGAAHWLSLRHPLPNGRREAPR